MDNPLNQMKFLKRSNINKQLEAAMNLPVCIVTASTGTGKTTALRDFFATKHIDVFWYSFKKNETDEVWLWNRIAQSICNFRTGKYKEFAKFNFPYTDCERRKFIKEIYHKIQEKTVIVLDDFHENKTENWNSLLIDIIQEAIPNLHICVVSRQYPNFPYTEWILSGNCMLIEQQNLNFSHNEISELFHTNEIELDKNNLENIYHHTEGWPSAVYLILLDILQNGNTNNLHKVEHLMKTAILDKMPIKVRELLLELSALDDFTLEEAIYVTNIKDCEQRLLWCVDSSNFINYDALTKVYRIHNLLRITALDEWKRAGNLEVSVLEKTALWYEFNQKYIFAIKYYLKIHRIESVFHILEGTQCYQLYIDAPVIFREFFDQLSLETKQNHIGVYSIYLYYLVSFHNDYYTNTQLAEIIILYEEKIQKSNNQEDREKLGELIFIDSLNHFNNLPSMIPLMERAFSLKEGKLVSAVSKNTSLIYAIPEYFTLFYSEPGSLKKTLNYEKCFFKNYLTLTGDWNSAFDWHMNGEYEFLRGNIHKAKHLADMALEKTLFLKNNVASTSMSFLKMRCCIYLGYKDELINTLLRLEQSHRNDTDCDAIKVANINIELVCGYILACIEMPNYIQEWILDYERQYFGRIYQGLQSGHITYGRILLQQRKYLEFEALAEQMISSISIVKSQITILYGTIYQSIAVRYLFGIEQAQIILQSAILMAEKDEIVAPFMENAIEILPVLNQLQLTPFIENIRNHCHKYQTGLKHIQVNLYIENDLETLTARENEIISFIMLGYKNTDIARELFIAIVTVEKALTGIYKKLGVKNRTELKAILKKK